MHPSSLDQAILCDFIVEGLGRHIRRMRKLHAKRLVVLQHGVRRCLAGVLDVRPSRPASTPSASFETAMTSQQAEAAALAHGIEAIALSRFAIKRIDVQALRLGFAVLMSPKSIAVS
jgi:DNA-binding transcriptional MocR family regulator